MDPLSLMIGFGRVLVPPKAMPEAVRINHEALTDLGLDAQLQQRIQAQLQNGPRPQGAPAAGPQGAQVQQAQQSKALEPHEKLDLIDPLYASRLKAIYEDRLMLTQRNPAERLEVFLASPSAPPDFSGF
ncbi:MAG: hypothetical protein ACK46X_20870 [Candidatus Sericytochromatia bacterium]